MWLIALEGELGSVYSEQASAVLSEEEKARAARFHFDGDRERWMRAHTALRLILARFTETPAADIRFAIGPHGKPALISGGVECGIEFNLSHSGVWAMIAVTRGAPVGVDIERIRENVNMAALWRRIGIDDASGSEADLFHAWTRREAMTKAVGGPLMESPAGDLHVRELVSPAGYCASIAMLGAEPNVLYQTP